MSSIVSLTMVDLSCAMDARSLAVAVNKFAMESTVSWWRHLLYRFVVVLCADI